MNVRMLCKSVLIQVGNLLSFFGITIFCGLVNAIGLVIFFFVIDSLGEETFGFSVARALETFLENSLGMIVDPLADTLPAFFLVAVLGYICGCAFGVWLHSKRSKNLQKHQF